MTPRTERLDALDMMIAENRLTRQRWNGTDEQGRATACLYAALVPDCDGSTDGCPADLMPQWLAACVPWIDDHGTVEAWPAMVRRFATALRGAATLSVEQWETVRIGWMADVVADAAKSSEYAVKYAKSAAGYAKSSEYAAKHAKYAAEYAEYAETFAKSSSEYSKSSESAAISAKYAEYAAGYAGRAESAHARCADRVTDSLLSRIERANKQLITMQEEYTIAVEKIKHEFVFGQSE